MRRGEWIKERIYSLRNTKQKLKTVSDFLHFYHLSWFHDHNLRCRGFHICSEVGGILGDFGEGIIMHRDGDTRLQYIQRIRRFARSHRISSSDRDHHDIRTIHITDHRKLTHERRISHMIDRFIFNTKNKSDRYPCVASM